MKRAHVVFSILLALAWPLAAAAQDAAPETEDETFYESVDVNVVNIEVFVRDRDDAPVLGLTKDDFQIFEDGRPVTITNFYSVSGGRPDVPEIAQVPEAPRQPTAIQPIPEDQKLHLVVYIDNFNIRPFNRNRVFSQLREFLHDHVGAQDQVMLVTYDRSLNIRRRFTSDASQISTALFDLEKLTGFALQADRDRKAVLKAIEDSDDSMSATTRVRQYASSVSNDLRFTIDALRDFIQSVAGLPGRKALLYVSDGLEMIPAQDLYYAVQAKYQDTSVLVELSQWDTTSRFRELAAQANSSGVTFYTVDATGLEFFGSSTAENARIADADGFDSKSDSIRIANLQSSIRYLADRTGGTAIVNVNDIGGGLDQVGADFESFYSLGYSPAHGGDGRYHSIEVKVERKGLKLRYRDGYRDKPVTTRMVEKTESCLRWGIQSNPLNARLVLGGTTPLDGDRWEVALLVQVPLGGLALLPRDDVYVGKIRVYYSALDEKGGTSPVANDEVSIRIPAGDLEKARAGYYTYEIRLALHQGRYRVGVGVRDEHGGTSSMVSGSVLAGAQG